MEPTQSDHELVRSMLEGARALEIRSRANPAELRFIDRIYERSQAAGGEFVLTDEQRTNFLDIVRTVQKRTRRASFRRK